MNQYPASSAVSTNLHSDPVVFSSNCPLQIPLACRPQRLFNFLSPSFMDVSILASTASRASRLTRTCVQVTAEDHVVYDEMDYCIPPGGGAPPVPPSVRYARSSPFLDHHTLTTGLLLTSSLHIWLRIPTPFALLPLTTRTLFAHLLYSTLLLRIGIKTIQHTVLQFSSISKWIRDSCLSFLSYSRFLPGGTTYFTQTTLSTHLRSIFKN